MKLYYQQTGYTCACATARMLIEHFTGVEKPEMDIEREMGTCPVRGSSTRDLINYIEKFGITSELVTNSNYDELKKGSSIKLLLYTVYGMFPHVGIIESSTDEGLNMVDPSSGKHLLKFKKLDDCWKTDENVKSFIKLSYEK